jgi:aldose sugar dehydrogenase
MYVTCSLWQNVENGDPLDGTSGIFRLTQDGQPAADNPLIGSSSNSADHGSSKHGKRGGEEEGMSSASPFLNYYYAYGIRNRFGIDFDPVTDKLWDTENGPTFGDEINLVNPAFTRLTWSQVMGIWKAGTCPGTVIGDDDNNRPKNLVSHGGAGVYRAPEFTWLPTIGPTALKFLDSVQLGTKNEV